jgi:nicotinamide-nucleotide amidase
MSTFKAVFQGNKKLTLAVAESITCGQLQARIGKLSGASEFFLGGITAYSLVQKVKHLGVNRTIAEAVNCVSSEVAEAMAEGVCKLFGSDVGCATTGYAEPSEANKINTPFAFWAVALRKTDGSFVTTHGRVDLQGKDRAGAQLACAEAAEQALLTITERASALHS